MCNKVNETKIYSRSSTTSQISAYVSVEELTKSRVFPTLSSSSDHQDQARNSYSIRRCLQTFRSTPQVLGALRVTPCYLEAQSFKRNDRSEYSMKNSMLKWLELSPNTNSLKICKLCTRGGWRVFECS